MCVRGGGGVNFQLFCSEWSSVNEHLPAHANLKQFLPLCSLLCHQEQTGRTSVLGQGSGQGAGGQRGPDATGQVRGLGWGWGTSTVGGALQAKVQPGYYRYSPLTVGCDLGTARPNCSHSSLCVCVCMSCFLSSGKTGSKGESGRWEV